jgi:hypothetical protein
MDTTRFDSFSEDDIQRMAAADGEDDWFDAAARPDRARVRLRLLRIPEPGQTAERPA